jgi:hypothetical protein
MLWMKARQCGLDLIYFGEEVWLWSKIFIGKEIAELDPWTLWTHCKLRKAKKEQNNTGGLKAWVQSTHVYWEETRRGASTKRKASAGVITKKRQGDGCLRVTGPDKCGCNSYTHSAKEERGTGKGSSRTGGNESPLSSEESHFVQTCF